MGWDNTSGRGGHNQRGNRRKHHNDGGSSNDQQNDGDQQNQQDQQKQQNQQNKQKQQTQQNQQNQQNQQSGNGQQNGKSTNNDQNNSKGSNDKIDWNSNGWVGTNHNKGKGKGKNVNHCCFWQEVSQDPYLRQVYGHFSQFLTDNRKAFCPSSSPSKSDAIMVEARQDKTDWQDKVEQTPNVSMLMSTEAGRFISRALHGYFEPCMNADALNETYMIVQQDPQAPKSRLVGKYMVHSRNPLLPNGPKDLFVQLQITLKPQEVQMVISPCDTNGFNFEGPVGVMNKYRRELTTPIDGYKVVGELDESPNGMYMSLIMGQAERAWEYIYSSLIKCPQ